MKAPRSLVLAALVLAATLGAGPATANTDPIQPGDVASTDVGGCTLNFVYDGAGGQNAGEVYLGIAAHCVERVGDDVSTNGEVFGDVAFVGDADDNEEDFAFIEVRPAYVDRVSPAVKGHAQYPTGVTRPDETLAGDLVQLSGYGIGFGVTQLTQEERVAVMGYDDHERYTVTGPLVFGDSGGPLVHVPSGKALGIVSRLCLGTCTETGPTVQGILDKAAAAGFPVTLRTVAGS